MNPNYILNLAGLILVLSGPISCKTKDLSADQYVAWIASHRESLSISHKEHFVRSTLTYLPIDWLALKETGLQHIDSLITTRQAYEGLEYYRLRVALEGAEGDILQAGAQSPDEYYERVEYFSFGLQNDLHLLIGLDTIPCKLFHFERNYGAAPYLDFMLAFEQRGQGELDRTLLFNDRIYSGTCIPLTIPAENISSIPNLKL